MIKRFLLAAVAVIAFLAVGSPVYASVPDWDAKRSGPGITWEHTPQEWAAISTAMNRPEDLAFSHLLPATPAAVQAKIAGDCEPQDSSIEKLCLWNGYSYGGTIWRIPISWLLYGDTQNNGISFVGSAINNASKGWWNRSYQGMVIYDADHCITTSAPTWSRYLAPGQFAVQDSAGDADWENRVSSASLNGLQNHYCSNDPNA